MKLEIERLLTEEEPCFGHGGHLPGWHCKVPTNPGWKSSAFASEIFTGVRAGEGGGFFFDTPTMFLTNLQEETHQICHQNDIKWMDLSARVGADIRVEGGIFGLPAKARIRGRRFAVGKHAAWGISRKCVFGGYYQQTKATTRTGPHPFVLGNSFDFLTRQKPWVCCKKEEKMWYWTSFHEFATMPLLDTGPMQDHGTSLAGPNRFSSLHLIDADHTFVLLSG